MDKLSGVMSEEDVMNKKAGSVDELLELLMAGMGDEMQERYRPAPEPEAPEAEDVLEEGQMQAGAEPGLAEDPKEEELLALLQALGGSGE